MNGLMGHLGGINNMLDVKDVLKRPDYYRELLATRESWYALLVDDIIRYYPLKKKNDQLLEKCLADRKQNSGKKITENDIACMKFNKALISNLEYVSKVYSKYIESILMIIPNLPHDSVPVGMVRTRTERDDKWLKFLNTKNIYDEMSNALKDRPTVNIEDYFKL